jgi:hypothetical protein
VTQPHKQVSETPLISSAPQRRGNNLLLLFLLACLVAIVTGGTLYWLDASHESPDTHVTRWPRDVPPDPEQERKGDYDEALKRMQTIANALLEYRDGPGGRVRWPDNLNVLVDAGLLPADFNFRGELSGEIVVFQPEMPIGHDPERWVLCHDVEIGRRRNMQNGYVSIGPRAAAVILADGSVKLIEGDELETYGGLNLAVNAGR